MSINAATIKKYKVVHTWTGIISSIVLFIAFYAGALAMFKPEISAWTQARMQAPAGSADIDALAAAFFPDDGSLSASATLALPHDGDPTARIYYTEDGKHRSAYLDQADQLQIIDDVTGGVDVGSARTVGDFVDDVHRAGGLPLDVEAAEPVIGIVSLLYGVALVSGVIVLLPSLVKDLFLLRITDNMRRMWLDAHNVLGLTSLPFHIVMALSAAVFGLHHYIYDVQNAVIYPEGQTAFETQTSASAPPPPSPAGRPKPPSELLGGLKEAAPDFQPSAIRYFPPRNPGQSAMARVQGVDEGNFQRGGRFSVAMLDPATGELTISTYLPGKQTATGTTLTSFFALHFGNYGGLPVRLLYIVLGVLGAMVFYSGNLLWIEARLSKSRPGKQAAEQPRHVRCLSSLTVGACLGCVAGLSASLLAARWLSLPSMAQDVTASYVYHGVFLVFMIIAFSAGAARATAPLLGLAAALSALIPLTSIIDAKSGASVNTAATFMPDYWLVDGFFAVAAALLLYLAYRARRRYQAGPRIFPRASSLSA